MKTASKKAILKMTGKTDDLIGNKIANKRTNVSKKIFQRIMKKIIKIIMKQKYQKKDMHLQKKDN